MSSASLLSKKITYITDQHLPVPKANSEQLVNTVAALANAGINIEMVIPREWRTLNYSRSHLKNEILDYYHVRDGFELTEILHLPFAPFKIDKLTHGIVASLYAIISKSDLIYTRNSLPALIGLHLGKRVLFEAYRIYDRHKNNAALRIARRTATSDAIGIITHSLPSKESLVAAGANEIKVKVAIQQSRRSARSCQRHGFRRPLVPGAGLAFFRRRPRVHSGYFYLDSVCFLLGGTHRARRFQEAARP